MSEAKINITADASGAEAAAKKAQAAFETAAERIKASFEGIGASFEKVQSAMIAITAALAGGKAFKEAVQETIALATGAISLGKALGITATQASILKVAMDENAVPMEAVTGAANKIAAAIRKNPEEFARMGVAVRDSNGNLRGSVDIMTDVNEHLLKIHEGTARNVAGQQIYGKSWGDIAATLKLTSEAQEEARKKAESLNLVIGKEGVAQAQDYRKTMAAVGTDFDAIEKTIGDAVIPSLTALGKWFDSIGPQAVAVMRGTMQVFGTVIGTIADSVSALWKVAQAAFANVGLVLNAAFGEPSVSKLEIFVNVVRLIEVAFIGLRVIVQEACDIVAGELRALGVIFTTFGQVADRALHLDWVGAKAAMADGFSKFKGTAAQAWKGMKQDAEQAGRDISKALTEEIGGASAQTPTKDKGGTTNVDTSEMKNRVAQFEAALEERKAAYQAEMAAEGQFREFSKQQEIEYWQNILATNRTSAAEKTAIDRKIAADTVSIQRQTFEASLETLKAEEVAQKNNIAARLAIEEQLATKIKAAYGADSKAFADAQKQIIATKMQGVEQQRQIDDIRAESFRTKALSDVQADEEAANLRYEEGRISLEQMIGLERDFENRKMAIREDALRQQMTAEANGPNNPVRVAQLNAQLEQLETQHQANLLKIKHQEATQEIQLSKQIQSALASGISSAMQGLINHTMTLGQAFKSVFQSMLGAVTNFIAEWAARELVQHALTMTQNKQEALSNSGVAATGAAKSAAQIPYVGWLLAIGAAASVFAAASSYSAAGGFDVPSGLNPMTQLHQNEMVLPAGLANRVRDMTSSDGPAGGDSGSDMHVHLHGKRYGNMFMAHEDDLVEALQSVHRKRKIG